MSEKEKDDIDNNTKDESLMSKFFKGNDLIRIKKYLASLALLVLLVLGLIFFITINNQKIKHQAKSLDKNISNINTAKDAIPGDVLWQEHLEEKMLDEQKARERDKLTLTENLQKVQKSQSEASNLISKSLEKDLSNLRNEIERLRQDNFNLAQNFKEISRVKNQPTLNSESPISNLNIESKVDNSPKDISWYIPAASYVKGVLLHGVAAFTGAYAQEEPQIVTIRLTDLASLPRGFDHDIEGCRVITSAYGNLSSERVLLRLETLSCVDRKTKKSLETKISGYVVGNDGLSGIKGRVVSMDLKYLNNAAVGGVLNGIAGAIRPDVSNDIQLFTNSQQPKDKSLLSKFGNNTASSVAGTTNALVDYYLKRAESIQPVIEIPSGVSVTMVITQGVYLGSKNIKNVIANERQK